MPTVKLGEWTMGVNATSSHLRTEYNRDIGLIDGKEVHSRGYAEQLDFWFRKGQWSVEVLVPFERREYRGSADVLDNTSLGLMVLPVYRLLRSDLHGFDFNVGANVGYQHTWYDDRGKLDSPLGTRWGMGDFRDPNLGVAGLMAGASVPLPIGRLGLSVAHEWAWDLNGDDLLAGHDSMDYTTVLARYQFPLLGGFYAATETSYSHTDDFPSQWDDSTCATSAELGYVKGRWGFSGVVRRDWANDNLNEWLYALTVKFTW